MPTRGLYRIFYSPGEVFQRADARPWLLPMLACIVIALALNTMIIETMGMGTLTRNQFESKPKLMDSLGREAVDRAVADAETNPGRKLMAYTASVLGVPMVMCLIAALTLGILTATGAASKFPAVLGAVSWPTYAGLVVTFFGSALFLIAAKDYSGVDPAGMVVLNASLFFDRETVPGWLLSIARSVDVVTYWTMFLQVIGLRQLSTSVSAAQAWIAVIIVYLLGVVFRAAAAILVT